MLIFGSKLAVSKQVTLPPQLVGTTQVGQTRAMTWAGQEVSTMAFSSPFACFPTVEYVLLKCSFLFVTSKLFKKNSMEAESSHSMGGANISSHSFCKFTNFMYKCMCKRQKHSVLEQHKRLRKFEEIFSLCKQMGGGGIG